MTTSFYSHFRSDQAVMLGLRGTALESPRPTTVLMDGDWNGDIGPIWFLTSTDADLVTRARDEDMATFTLVSKAHDIFATVHGHLTRVTDPAVIHRHWIPAVVSCCKDSKNDLPLALLR